jgi:hypothetical protein
MLTPTHVSYQFLTLQQLLLAVVVPLDLGWSALDIPERVEFHVAVGLYVHTHTHTYIVLHK